MRTRLVVAVVLLLAGCSGLSGGDDAGGRTVNPNLQGTVSPTASPTPTPEYPSGVTAEGVDPWILANAHHRTLASDGATVRSNRTIVGPDGVTLATVESRYERSGSRVASGFTVGGAAPERVGVPGFDYALWSDGNETATMRTRPDGEAEYSHFTGSPPSSLVVPGTGRDAVYRVLADVNVTVAGPEVVDGETRFPLRAESDRVERVGAPTRSNYSLVASVTEDGVVRSYRVRYEEEREGVGVVSIREEFRVSDLGNTTVPPPQWVEDARQESE
ncbi:hypothetical protein HUG10_09755 [Halorarum halophilum]|uniref:Uncharacterized protein n=1 Tax=Halorarum halophilum TaxID=2743090 RepID=A0A7D5K7V2_9EURY|nr:hypothetical protein [Halobaculum halophilum]QLG27819.1 hypothetical protein HUG10_09755 [Halobaculum halophilum]